MFWYTGASMPLEKTEWDVRKEYQARAAGCEEAALPELLDALKTTYKGAFWPEAVVVALIHNTKLPIDRLVSSQASPALYKSALQHLAAVCAPLDATADTRDARELFRSVIKDPQFSAVDDAQFKAVVHEVAKNSPLADLAGIRTELLLQCTPGRFSSLNEAFLHRAYLDALTEEQAQKILTNLSQSHTYPFHDQYRFLVWVISQAGGPVMRSFLYNDLSRVVPTGLMRERVLLQLAERAPYDFPVFFYKYQRHLTRGLQTKYSAELKHVRKLCWDHLSLMQKVLTLVPVLL